MMKDRKDRSFAKIHSIRYLLNQYLRGDSTTEEYS